MRPIAVKFNLTLDAFGVVTTTGSGLGGLLNVSTAFTAELKPSPITPSGSSEPFTILSGTIQAVLKNSEVHPSSAAVVTPTLSLGMTQFSVESHCAHLELYLPGNTGTFIFMDKLFHELNERSSGRYSVLLELDQTYIPLLSS